MKIIPKLSFGKKKVMLFFTLSRKIEVSLDLYIAVNKIQPLWFGAKIKSHFSLVRNYVYCCGFLGEKTDLSLGSMVMRIA